jgi:hypothetical protein
MDLGPLRLLPPSRSKGDEPAGQALTEQLLSPNRERPLRHSATIAIDG